MLDDLDLRLLLDLAPAGMVLLQRADRSRPAPTVGLVNQAFCELTGLAADALVGRSLRVLRSVLEPDEMFADLLTAAITGEPFAGRLRIRSPAGPVVAALARGQALGQRPETYAVWLDAEKAEATSTARADPFRLLASLSGECFYELAVEVDCGLRLVWADARVVELTGYDLDELQAMGGFFGLVASADLPGLHRRNQRLLTNQPGPIRYRVRRKSGELHWLLDTARAERAGEADIVRRVVGTLAGVGEGASTALAQPALARLAALLADTLAACLLVLDVHGRLVWASDRPAEPMGARLRDQVGQNLSSVLPSRHLGSWLDWLDEAAAARQPLRCRLGWANPDGDIVLEAQLAPLGDDLVQVVAWQSPPQDGLQTLVAPLGQSVLDALREPLALIAVDLRVLQVNSAFERLLGGSRVELLGQPIADRLGTAGSRDRIREALERMLAGREAEARLSIGCMVRGGERELELRFGALTPVPGRVDAVLIEAQRVDDRGQPQPSNGESWLNAVMNSVADGIVLLDLEGTINWLSSSAETIFDYPRDAAIGASIDLLLPLPTERGGSLLNRLQAPRPGGVPLELTLRRRSGELLPVEVESSIVEQRDRRMIVLVIRDLTGRRQTEETLRSLAYHDPLTGLPNRLLFHDRLSQAIERARRARQLLTVMLVDLDRFKLINDSLGLVTGDQIIKGVADRLVQKLRKSDTVARLGGDEFMVLLLGTTGAESAARVAQKLLDVLRPPLQVDGHELTTSASIGIALFPHDGDDADTLIKNADNALSRAKEQGRNHYQFYTDDMNATAFERLMLESRLRKALEQDEFVIYYQPKIGLADGAVVGVEALLRWFHPDLGLVPPGEFIPLAEETG
ncbi:MAG: diguanylate cyclase domain-containing protein, partial [Geminicoccaceae bacterium]